ncbi:MAG: hypothetical protein KAI64_07650 [Thermoplasmata archaeon]|nr:hypothetical protein [Thermoplasmata archaeon]
MDRFWQRVLDRVDKLDRGRIEEYLEDLSTQRDFFKNTLDEFPGAVLVLGEDLEILYIN